jgi:predicted S18 family serine protease
MEIKTSEELREKINELKEKVVDLSADEDLALAVMNLISMEEHLYFTAEKTGKDEYFDLLNQVREIRKKMMERLIGKPEGELWCFVKHTLSATMRLIEVGTKLQNQNKKDEAKEVFDLAYELFNIFWGIKLNIIKLYELKKEESEYKEITEESKSGFSLKKLIEKIIDCCKE